MKELIKLIEALKNSEIIDIVDTRINEFSEIKRKSADDIFKELCFCIMTANCAAAKCIEIHEKINHGFLSLSEIELIKKFKELKYRFPSVRAKYVVEAREYKNEIEKKVKSHDDGNELRDWIVKNIKGIGYKEGSHFLRNIGFKNYAIIDFHVIDLLVKQDLIVKPKTLTRKKYLEIEGLLKNLGRKLDLNLAELDLFLWFLETGKILK